MSTSGSVWNENTNLYELLSQYRSFLPRVIAAKHGNRYCLSVRLSHRGIISTKEDLWWCGFMKQSSQFFDKLCDASGSVVHRCNCEFSAISGYNSEIVEVRIKQEYEVICDCLNDVICTDLKWPMPRFQGRSTLNCRYFPKVNISKTVHFTDKISPGGWTQKFNEHTCIL